jgi:hypothetical protein
MCKKIVLIYVLTLLLINGRAQDCKVAMDSLKGKYEGQCKNGKAEGIGKAEGTDAYEGEFKAGLPEGNGKYTWKNGNWYDGHWYKGKREGEGKMLYKLADQDSLVNGFWKRDAYAGKYEKSYLVHYKTIHVTHLSATVQNKLLNQIDIVLDSETGHSPVGAANPGALTPKPELTDMTVTEGTYLRRTQNDNYGKKIGYTLEEVTFPFRVIFTVGNDSIDLEFFEAGRWNVEIRLAY